MLAGRADAGALIATPAFREAVKTVAEERLALEILVRPAQMACLLNLIELAPQPETIVIGHAGKPEIGVWGTGGKPFRDWASAMRMLAEAGCSVKVSGLVTECGDDWAIDLLRPYWDILVEEFGATRLIWGSDWPVIERAGGYQHWLEAVLTVSAPLGHDAQSAIFGVNAARVYQL